MRAQAGLVLTILFVPNIMTLDLREGDRRFDALMARNPAAYTGDAVAPENLSVFERCAAALAGLLLRPRGWMLLPESDAVQPEPPT